MVGAHQIGVTLDRFVEGDIARLVGWIDSPGLLMQWAGPGFSFPLDERQLSRHLEDANKRDHQIFKAIHDAEVCGHVEVATVDEPTRRGRLARVLVGPRPLRGQGLGRSIVTAAMKYAFGELRLSRVELSVFSHNEPAINCYLGLGFNFTGTTKTFEACGSHWTSLTMQIDRGLSMGDEWSE